MKSRRGREESPDDRGGIAAFVEAYARVREAEGYAGADAEASKSLPFRDPSGRNRGRWRVRAFHYLLLRGCLVVAGRRVRRVLDLGAGNGWLARRLRAGWDVTAVDVDAGASGLGALGDTDIPRIRAEIDRLPFAPGAFDAVVMAASLHHAVDLAATLREVHRVLRPGGLFLVADSPVYGDAVARGRAARRTLEHYTRMGAPELALRYRGLTRAEIEGPGLFTWLTVAPGRPLRSFIAGLRGGDTGASLPVMVGIGR